MIADELRELSLDTSYVAVRNISASDHTGLVTLLMERGVVKRVWCGTQAGLLLWNSGITRVHVVRNVEQPLIHG